MSFESLLEEKGEICDIYHLQTRQTAQFGVETEGEPYYSDQPDKTAVASIWTLKSSNVSQSDPHQQISETWMVLFDSEEDVRLNDKVMRDGVEYRLGPPRRPGGHHIEVEARRRPSTSDV